MEQNSTIKSIQHLSLAQIAVLNAIRSGCTDAKTISEKTGQFEVGVVEVLKSLSDHRFIKYENGVAELPPRDESKTIKLGGNLNLPVSQFRDEKGQLFVSRGSWHKIPEGTTLDMIDWFDDTQNEESELQKVMRGVKEQKIKEKKAALPSIKDEDGEPTVEDMKCLGAWRMVNDNIKIYPCEVSAKRAITEISPRFRAGDLEYPYGVCSPKQVITIEVLHELLNGDATNLPKYSFDDAMMYIPNTFPVKTIEEEGNVIGFEYLSIKKSSDGMKIVDTDMYLVPKEKFKTVDTILLNKAQGCDYIRKVAVLSSEACTALQEQTTK